LKQRRAQTKFRKKLLHCRWQVRAKQAVTRIPKRQRNGKLKTQYLDGRVGRKGRTSSGQTRVEEKRGTERSWGEAGGENIAYEAKSREAGDPWWTPSDRRNKPEHKEAYEKGVSPTYLKTLRKENCREKRARTAILRGKDGGSRALRSGNLKRRSGCGGRTIYLKKTR